MNKFKYILDEHNNFAIFSETNTHEDIAKGFHFKPVSAGFCYIMTNYDLDQDNQNEIKPKVECFGESISLNLKSRKEDSDIIIKKIQESEY